MSIAIPDKASRERGEVIDRPHADQAFGAAAAFIGALETMAWCAKHYQGDAATTDAWKDYGGTYAEAFVAWFDLTYLLTPEMREAVRRVYSPGAPSIRVGKLKAKSTVIEAIADGLGTHFRNLLYQDRRHPLEPDRAQAASEAKSVATARQVSMGKSARPMSWGADFEELMKKETRAAVRQRLGIKTLIDAWLFMARAWESQNARSVAVRLKSLCYPSIDFDEVKTMLDREAHTVLAAADEPRAAMTSKQLPGQQHSDGSQGDDDLRGLAAEAAALFEPADPIQSVVVYIPMRASDALGNAAHLFETGGDGAPRVMMLGPSDRRAVLCSYSPVFWMENHRFAPHQLRFYLIGADDRATASAARRERLFAQFAERCCAAACPVEDAPPGPSEPPSFPALEPWAALRWTYWLHVHAWRRSVGSLIAPRKTALLGIDRRFGPGWFPVETSLRAREAQPTKAGELELERGWVSHLTLDVFEATRLVLERVIRVNHKTGDANASPGGSLGTPVLPQALQELWSALEGRILDANELAAEDELNTSPEAIWQRVSELRRSGREVGTLPGRGYYRPDAPPPDGL